MLNKSKINYESLIQYFPFLYPRNVWTDKPIEDYGYDWCLGVDELPEGWIRLFLLYCNGTVSGSFFEDIYRQYRID